MSFKKGFTLIEYLVAIALMGLLVAAFVFSASHFFPSIRLRGTASNLVTNLRQTQEEAVTAQVRHSLRFNSNTHPTSYQIIKINGAQETSIKTVDFPVGMDVDLAPDFSGEVIFSPDGGPGASGDIILSAGGSSRTVNISPAGVIKLQ